MLSWLKEMWVYIIALFSSNNYCGVSNGAININSDMISVNEVFKLLNQFRGNDVELFVANKKIYNALLEINGVAIDILNSDKLYGFNHVDTNKGLICFMYFVSKDGKIYIIKLIYSSDMNTITATDVYYLGKSRLYTIDSVQEATERNMAGFHREEDINLKNFKTVLNVQLNSIVLSISNVIVSATYNKINTDHYELGFANGELKFLDRKTKQKKVNK